MDILNLNNYERKNHDFFYVVHSDAQGNPRARVSCPDYDLAPPPPKKQIYL